MDMVCQGVAARVSIVDQGEYCSAGEEQDWGRGKEREQDWMSTR
jgi:hypothetical protein